MQVITLLAGKDSWTFDSFALDEATDHRPLSALAFAVFKETGIIKRLQLNQSKLVS